MKRLILVRHGESEWNKLNLFTGWTDVDLSQKGMEEARKAGQTVLANGYRPQYCFTSYLKRAIKTLNIMLDEMNMDWLPVHKDWRLNEKHYGELQGLNKSEMAEKYGEEKVLLWRRAYNVRPPEVDLHADNSPRNDPRYNFLPDEMVPLTESLEDTIIRLTPFYVDHLLKSFESYDEILVVAHGNSLRGVVKLLKYMTEAEILKFNIPTGIPYIFEFNDSMHLQNDFFLGDQDEIKALMDSVANQGKTK